MGSKRRIWLRKRFFMDISAREDTHCILAGRTHTGRGRRECLRWEIDRMEEEELKMVVGHRSGDDTESLPSFSFLPYGVRNGVYVSVFWGGK